jgi:outer membrane protein assembly factor BamA
MKTIFLALLLAASLAVPVFAPAQTMVAKSITFTGAPQSQEELLKLSGLTVSKTLSKADIDAAANRLDASGLFTSVQWSSAQGVLTFALEPAAKAQMQVVRYANFVWYTQSELNDLVNARLPLFTGSVPSDGALKDQVAETLTGILKQRGIEATVEAQGVAGGKLEYRIASPPVMVTDVQIDNVRWESDPVLESVRKAMVGVEYLEGISQKGVHDNVAYALKELGYLDESVGPIGHAEPKLEAGRIAVVMTGAATPGDRYKVGRVTLPTPAGTVTAKELETSDHQIKVGGLPSPSLVDNTVARMAFVFQGHGFLDARASVDTSRDSTAHTISYTFAVAPGDVYHMRDLVFAADLTAEQKAQLTQAWKLPKGEVYERTAVERALMTARTLCAGRPVSQKLLPDAASHQVDVSLSCKPQR